MHPSAALKSVASERASSARRGGGSCPRPPIEASKAKNTKGGYHNIKATNARCREGYIAASISKRYPGQSNTSRRTTIGCACLHDAPNRPRLTQHVVVACVHTNEPPRVGGKERFELMNGSDGGKSVRALVPARAKRNTQHVSRSELNRQKGVSRGRDGFKVSSCTLVSEEKRRTSRAEKTRVQLFSSSRQRHCSEYLAQRTYARSTGALAPRRYRLRHSGE